MSKCEIGRIRGEIITAEPLTHLFQSYKLKYGIDYTEIEELLPGNIN